MYTFQQIGVQTAQKMTLQNEDLKRRIEEYESLVKSMKEEYNREIKKLKTDLSFQTK
jgi:hypothetical protein